MLQEFSSGSSEVYSPKEGEFLSESEDGEETEYDESEDSLLGVSADPKRKKARKVDDKTSKRSVPWKEIKAKGRVNDKEKEEESVNKKQSQKAMEMRKKQADDLETEAEINTDKELEMVRRGGVSALSTTTSRRRGQPQKAGKSKQPEDLSLIHI